MTGVCRHFQVHPLYSTPLVVYEPLHSQTCLNILPDKKFRQTVSILQTGCVDACFYSLSWSPAFWVVAHSQGVSALFCFKEALLVLVVYDGHDLSWCRESSNWWNMSEVFFWVFFPRVPLKHDYRLSAEDPGNFTEPLPECWSSRLLPEPQWRRWAWSSWWMWGGCERCCACSWVGVQDGDLDSTAADWGGRTTAGKPGVQSQR